MAKIPSFVYLEMLNEITEHNSKIRSKEQHGFYIPAKKLPRIKTAKRLNAAQKTKIAKAYKMAFPTPVNTTEVKIPKMRGEKDKDYWNRVVETRKKFSQSAGRNIRFNTEGEKGTINKEGFLEWRKFNLVYWYVPIPAERLAQDAQKEIKALIKKYKPFAVSTAHEFYQGVTTGANPPKPGKTGSFRGGQQRGILNYLKKFQMKYNLAENPHALTGFVLIFRAEEIAERELKSHGKKK